MSRVKMRVTNPKVDGPPKRLSRKKNTVQPALAYRRVTMRLAEPLNSFGRVNPTYTKAKLKPILISPRITPITPASSRLTRRAEAAKNTPASPAENEVGAQAPNSFSHSHVVNSSRRPVPNLWISSLGSQ